MTQLNELKTEQDWNDLYEQSQQKKGAFVQT